MKQGLINILKIIKIFDRVNREEEQKNGETNNYSKLIYSTRSKIIKKKTYQNIYLVERKYKNYD